MSADSVVEWAMALLIAGGVTAVLLALGAALYLAWKDIRR